MSNERSPQSGPPSIDLGHLTETVTRSIQSALAQHQGTPLLHNPRIIVGIIAEPHFGQGQQQGGTEVGKG